MASGYFSPLAIGLADGPTLTAAAAATCIPTTARFTFPPNSIMPGTILRVQAQGRISCVVTTPGTARFDCRLNNVVCFDTGAMALNTVAKTTLPWWLDIQIVCRAAGVASTASFFGFAQFQSEAVVGSALASTAGAQGFVSSVSTGPEGAPAPISTNVDTTVSCPFEMFFTQTVATGSFTVHNYVLSSASLALT